MVYPRQVHMFVSAASLTKNGADLISYLMPMQRSAYDSSANRLSTTTESATV